MAKIVGLMGAKKNSTRLPNKAKLDFNGRPMFEWNIIKGVSLFEKMYVTSDDDEILQRAKELGAYPIKREDPKLMDAPNIVYFQHALGFMDNPDGIVALQINSPTLSYSRMEIVKKLLELGVEEVMTSFPIDDHQEYHNRASRIYGSIWGLSTKKLKNYPNPYKPKPEVLVVDPSTDIHYQEDLDKALNE